MKCVSVDLGNKPRMIEIMPISDVHYGSPEFNFKDFKKQIDYIKENDDVYTILNGDLIDNSTKTSVGDVYSEQVPPLEQIKGVINFLEPIKDKILGITNGNHCLRTYKQDGIDLMWIVAKTLGLEDRYDATSLLVFVRFGKGPGGRHTDYKYCYTIYSSHGDGINGKTVGGRANGLERRGNIVDADVIITSHTHSPLIFSKQQFKIDYHNSSVNCFEQVFVNTGANLDYSSYAERYGLAPTSMKKPVIVLNGKGAKEVVAYMK